MGEKEKKIPWHLIKFFNILPIDSTNASARITIFRACMLLDSLENPVASFSPFNIPRSPPHDKNTFDNLFKKGKKNKIQQKRLLLKDKKWVFNLRSETPIIRVWSIIISSARISFWFWFSHSRWYITLSTSRIPFLNHSHPTSSIPYIYIYMK